ncbi:hypothetical protein [Leptospira santarosai]|uniref:PF07598 family protein n=5 Tax=Leptospira santarosai TaxID=28183 RepID=A0AB73LP58_9LEPT|nr:hypothetical protein [Leptospira santarosai]ASV12035.1 hypothetical protein B2G51_10275 [Leptospira santarosai]AVV51694.1 Uncharacterized protein XB17_03122 [Leptospira santarosai]EKO32803.1 hypothetical protein LEP1GSC179_3080 [Leptospira santarosai str. MOR084]EKR90179.1 hypothetical protein LEP1GSC163_3137 [Leptospira santarosai str. CBC379]EKT86259.1 hypothetical protein LSS_12939 [Leptospira santarosai serovar Shermani str. LT 821]
MKLNLYTNFPKSTVIYRPEVRSHVIQRYTLMLSQLDALLSYRVYPLRSIRSLRSLMSDGMRFFLKRAFRFSLLLSVVLSSNLVAQEESQIVKEKMVCQKIELVLNGQNYDDGYKCITPGAICYLVEGLSLSCFASPESNQPKTN